MNNNHRITLNTNKNIIVEFTNERIIPASGLAVVGALLGKSGFIKKLNRMDITSNRSQHQIKNGDIVLTYLGMLCMGKPYFEAVHEMDDDKDFYKTALANGLVPVDIDVTPMDNSKSTRTRPLARAVGCILFARSISTFCSRIVWRRESPISSMR